MERKMRRFKQQLTEQETVKILTESTAGVLSLCGNDMQPYGVPLSHIYHDGNLYFHSALNGHKLDLISENSKACFSVIAQDEIHPETFTTYFRSAIAFGSIKVIEDEDEKRKTLEMLGKRCNPHDKEALDKEIERGFARCKMLEMSIETLSGKQAIELVNR